jgi:hypothetical protein
MSDEAGLCRAQDEPRQDAKKGNIRARASLVLCSRTTVMSTEARVGLSAESERIRADLLGGFRRPARNCFLVGVRLSGVRACSR